MTLTLTPGQASIWFGQAARPGTSLYQCAELLVFEGDVDADLLEETITSCLRQLPALQSEFREGPDGAPRMVPAARDHAVRRTVFRGEETALLSWAHDQIRVPAMTEPGVIGGDELSGQTLVELLPQDGTTDAVKSGGAGTRWAWLARFHHILGDGFAVHTIIRWVAACYTAAVSGKAAPEPPFLDSEEVLERRRRYSESEQAERDRSFWEGVPLGTDPAGLALRAAPAAEEIRTAEAGISPEIRRRLRELARSLSGGEAGETELLAVVVAHYTAVFSGAAVEGEDVVLGLPLMNRPLGESQVALEPAVNVLPLRLSPGVQARGAGLAEQLAEAADRLRELREHGLRRAEEIRRDRRVADPSRRLTGPGLNIKPFASRFRFGSAEAALTTVAVGPVEDADLLFQARPDGGFQLRVLANAAAHTGEEAEAHARRLALLLEQLAGAEPAGADAAEPRLSDLEILLPQERRRVLGDYNATDHALTVPEDSTLTSLLRARRSADLAAEQEGGPQDAEPVLHWDGERLSRREVWEQVDALAGRLQALGAAPGVLVGVQLRRGPALPLTLAAVVACGAAWVPLDPDQPEARRGLMVETSEPGLIVRGRESLPQQADGLPQVRLDESALRPAKTGAQGEQTGETPAAASALEEPTPDDLAYVLFTSGSTGTPKGVAVSQRAIVNRLDWMATDYGITGGDVILQKTPCSFDVSVWEFMLPFTHGAGLAVAADGAHRDPALLHRELRDAEVTTCHFVPSALKAFLDGSGVSSAEDLPALRQVFASGEALEPGLARRFSETLGVELHNLYGPTEAAVDVTAHTYVPGEPEVPIGAPVWNTRCYVLDEALRPVPPGVAGQLYLAGVQLADGYIGREDLTAERFILDPFVQDRRPGERMYATGDIARWRADGELLYYGRADSQVKLRGQRIELGEIEAVLAEHSAIGQCAVLAREVAGEQTLIGYAVLAEHGTGGSARGGGLPAGLETELYGHLTSKLPGYMVPSALIAVEALPTTLNGKLDTNRLPLPERGAAEFVPAGSPLEHTVQGVFAEVLELHRVSVTENFFDAGGTSLSAVRLTSGVGLATGAEIGIADVFAAPTARELTARISGRGTAEDPFGPLLTLREHRSGTPVLCFHPAGGLGWSYAGLLPRLDRGRGVYALQSPGLTDRSARPGTLAEAAERAADAAQEILDRTHSESADLLGWSVGGVLAQAAGVVLQRRGVPVRRLVLMDAYPAELWKGRTAPSEQERLQGLLIMAGLDAPEGQELTQEGVVSAIRETGSPFSSLPEEVLHGVTEMVGHNARLMREHSTERFPGAAQLFTAGLNPEALDESAWVPHMDELDVVELPCTHPGMVRPESLQQVAEALAGQQA